MTNLLEIGLINAGLASLLAVVVWLATRVWRQPVFAHALWVIVLLKLVTPPMASIPWQLRDTGADSPALAQSATSVVADRMASPTRLHPDLETAQIIPRSTLKAPVREITRTNTPAQVERTLPEGQPAATAGLPFSWTTIAAVTWIVGSIVFLIVTVVRLVRFQRALARTEIAPLELRELAQQVAARVGIAGGYRLRVTAGRLSPLVWPIGRPTILLSLPLLAELSAEQTQTLLAHELAHLRRKDHWVRWLELVALTIYWWHPVAWWARTMIHRMEERACDAWVVWAFPDAAKRYAAALFTAVEFVSPCRMPAPLVASRLDVGGNIKDRIEDIMSKNLTSRLSFPAWTALVVLAIVVLPLSLRVVAAADERTEAAGDLPEASTTAEAADSAERLAIAPDAPAPSQNGRTLEARLETPIKVHFTETPLDQALDALSNDIGVDIYLDPRGLEQEGVASDAPVTVELKNEVALKSALNLLLKPLHLTFVVEDEVIKVTSEEAKRTNVSTIQPSSVLSIRVIGAIPEQRIADRFAVDPEGYVDLGRPYGRVHVAGWTAEHAETVLAQVLQTKIRHPKVEVSPIDAAAGQSGEPNAARAYRISAGDLLQVSAVGVDPAYPLHDVFGVEPGGTLALGPTYGRVKVAGQTLEESEAAVRDTLELKFKDPRVQITLAVPQSGRTDPFAGDLRAYSAAHHAASSSGESTPEELAVLREHVAFLKAQFDAIDAKFRAGNRGGEAEIREMTGYELETARADLAQAEGRLDEAAAHLKEAEAFAEHALKSVQATYDVGRITHDVVLQAAHNLAEIKRRLARHQQSQMPPSANYHIAELPRAANRSADARTRAVSKLNPSARAWKQDVENKQRAYERAQTLSNKGVISAAELGQAKVDYEFSVANFESALRRLKHSQLLVELAETEYEQALASNKAVPNSVSEFELRKLRIKVELAKLEMGEAE